MKFRNLLFAGCLSLAFASCSKDTMQEISPVNPQAVNQKVSQATTTITEDFETGSKSAYAAGDVTLTTGSWNLDDALIGSTTSDVKSGTKSVRIRNTGILSMNFNVSSPSSVSVKHAVYGTDNSSTWQLWVSNDNGSTFTQVGSTVTTSSGQLATATFPVSKTGNLTFEIRKISGGTARINIDDISFITGGTTPTDPGTDPGTGTPGNTADNNNLLLGNPTNAQPSINSTANYLMDQTYFTESYNRDKGTPNWVSWHISSTDLGSASRSDNFRADVNLPSGWYAVGNSSYSGSGFDRGHNCPSGDRTSSSTANSATFLMTNMIPQAPKNNQQTWANLENYTRSLVTAGNEVYVVMGSYGSGGTGTNGYVTTIDGGKVNVPSRVWKVIVVIPNGNNDLSRISSSTRVIAVDTPNDQSTVNADWKQYLTTVRSIESAAGVNIMSNVSQSIQNVIEARTDSGS
ncbi:DNA/RNA non-specific endonuclease [Pedobacter sp. NJ-S-72]